MADYLNILYYLHRQKWKGTLLRQEIPWR